MLSCRSGTRTIDEGNRSASNGTARALLQGRKYGMGRNTDNAENG